MNGIEAKTDGDFSAHSHTILVIDDEPANLAIVVDYLAGYGFQIKVAQTGETGLELARQTHPPDLILLDVVLPGIDGLETCRRLKADESTREIPVIFMTILIRVEDKVKGFEAGGVDYITKPFQQEEVLARVVTHLRLRDLTRRLEEAKESLERRVEERTVALTQANQDLQAEIAERRRAKAALQDSEERLRLTMEAANIGSWDWDVKNDVWSASPIYYTMLGYAPKAGPADRNEWLERVHPDDQSYVAAKIQGVLARDFKEHRYEARLRHADGTYRWQYIRGFGIERDEKGNVTRMLGIRMDITERKQAEEEIHKLNQELEQRVLDRTAQLEAANKELETFAYSVSHDLRAPLRAISGFTAILTHRHRANLNDEGRHYLDNVTQAAERMGRLIDDFLAYSRLGRADVRRKPVALHDIFRSLAKEFVERLKEIGGTLEIADDLPTVMGDRTLLTQIFTNLLDNALTYYRADVPARVTVTHQTEAETATICVRDNGIGVPPEHYEKIFNIFQRLHSDEDYPGTGIGLTTVKKSVEMLGGWLWVESEVGQGSTFFVKLPKE